MSDTEKRDAIMSARRLGKTAYAIRLVEEFVRLRDENIALAAAVERVRALHQPIAKDIPKCVICKNYDGRHVDHPCPTLRALEETP